MQTNLTDEDVRMLAELERNMDIGKQPYVVLYGMRQAISVDVMNHFNLQIGQTVSNEMIIAILQYNIQQCRIEIAEQETDKVINRAMHK